MALNLVCSNMVHRMYHQAMFSQSLKPQSVEQMSSGLKAFVKLQKQSHAIERQSLPLSYTGMSSWHLYTWRCFCHKSTTVLSFAFPYLPHRHLWAIVSKAPWMGSNTVKLQNLTIVWFAWLGLMQLWTSYWLSCWFLIDCKFKYPGTSKESFIPWVPKVNFK